MMYSYNKSQRDALFLKFILVKNSTLFGHIYCPSSGCCVVTPACFVLLFCRNHFIDVYLPYVNCSSRVYVMHVKGNSSKNSVRTCLPRNQSGQWYMVKHLRRPAIAGPIS